MLFLFGRLSLSGLVSNIVTVPIAFLTVLSGCCSIVFGQVSVLFSDLFNHASLGLIILLQGLLERFASIPYAVVKGVQFGLFQVLFWYALLVLLTAVFRGFFSRCGESANTGQPE